MIFKKKKHKGQSEASRFIYQLSRNKMAMAGLVILLIEIIIAILAPYIAPYGYQEIDSTALRQGPSKAHIFGTDEIGRDIFSRVIVGARYSLSMGLIATTISSVIGIVIGAIAGFAGGRLDNLIMRILDVIQSLPAMLLVIVLSAVLGSGYFNTILALSVGGIPGAARMLRANMLKQRQAEYIEAAYSINCSPARIIFKHLVPNSISANIVSFTMGISGTITQAASLSFIGLGIQPPIPDWGAMLSGARAYIRKSPHMVIFPGLAIAITVLAVNMLGDGVRDAMDPKLKK